MSNLQMNDRQAAAFRNLNPQQQAMVFGHTATPAQAFTLLGTVALLNLVQWISGPSKSQVGQSEVDITTPNNGHKLLHDYYKTVSITRPKSQKKYYRKNRKHAKKKL